jgi:F0F1-type ATP synthase assembly protein I
MARGGKDPGDTKSPLLEVARFSGHGLTLALAMGVFLLAGWWLDGRLGTTPLLTIVGALVGAGGGFYHILQHLLFFPRERAREAEQARGSGSGAGGDPESGSR